MAALIDAGLAAHQPAALLQRVDQSDDGGLVLVQFPGQIHLGDARVRFHQHQQAEHAGRTVLSVAERPKSRHMAICARRI